MLFLVVKNIVPALLYSYSDMIQIIGGDAPLPLPSVHHW